MSPEENELLKKSVELAEENNNILRYIKSSIRISSIMRAVYWIFIIGSAVGAYYFIQPFVDQLMKMYGGANSSLESFSEMFKNFGK